MGDAGAEQLGVPGSCSVSLGMYGNRIKPVLDRVGAGIGLVVLSPLLVAVGAVIRFTDRGSVFYWHERIGREGKPFMLLKFRTMIQGADVLGGGYTPQGLDLITPVGRVLRRSSVDEIPQLWNVLRGEMSLIGPRPAVRSQVERYSDAQRRRLAVRPGITGLAQVEGRNEWTWTRRIERDLYYVNNLTAALDLKIVLRTLSVVVSKRGYRTDQCPEDVDDL